MRIKLKKGDKVSLLPTQQLFQLFEQRNFFSSDFRQKAAEVLGKKDGVVSSIEDKYAFDYFLFLPNGETISWSVPYKAVNFNTINHDTRTKH